MAPFNAGCTLRRALSVITIGVINLVKEPALIYYAGPVSPSPFHPRTLFFPLLSLPLVPVLEAQLRESCEFPPSGTRASMLLAPAYPLFQMASCYSSTTIMLTSLKRFVFVIRKQKMHLQTNYNFTYYRKATVSSNCKKKSRVNIKKLMSFLQKHATGSSLFPVKKTIVGCALFPNEIGTVKL